MTVAMRADGVNEAEDGDVNDASADFPRLSFSDVFIAAGVPGSTFTMGAVEGFRVAVILRGDRAQWKAGIWCE